VTPENLSQQQQQQQVGCHDAEHSQIITITG